MENKIKIFKSAFNLFIESEVDIPDYLVEDYLNDDDGEGQFAMQEYLINNMKESIRYWSTGIGIMDAVDIMYESAIENGNIKQ